ncbi:hypothetical protein B4135_3093 [Caldibacillus debilis]|uniref:Uncharacterized protein n=1 Tax=Caldibacillus debilis TaxID=301148 RepID=A0A150LJN0_9BACI|nr:hypothetical protein B4135_3093 [Caldibacillus debilis]
MQNYFPRNNGKFYGILFITPHGGGGFSWEIFFVGKGNGLTKIFPSMKMRLGGPV